MTATPRTPPKLPRPVPAPRTGSYTLTQLSQNLQGDELAAALRGLYTAGTPLIEERDSQGAPLPAGEYTVTFLWEDARAQAVLLFANRLTDERNLDASLLERVGQSSTWSISYRMKGNWRATYCLIPAYPGEPVPWLSAGNQAHLRTALDRGLADPHNRLTCLNRAGSTLSLVELPAAPSQPYALDATDCLRLPAPSWQEAGGCCYALHRVGSPRPDSPLVVLFDGEVWAQLGLPQSLDAAHRAGKLPALTLLLLHSGGRERRWAELDGSAPVADTIADSLLPALAETGQLTGQEEILLAGQSLGGLSALLAGAQRPADFPTVISSSASLWNPVLTDALTARQEAGTLDQLAGSRWWVEVGEQEWVLTGPHRQLRTLLAETPVELTYRTYNGGHDYACWRGSLIDALIALTAEPPAPSAPRTAR